jgi:N-acetylglucosaminyl-diphospho-decaprenol L-rhamnosyltransferase
MVRKNPLMIDQVPTITASIISHDHGEMVSRLAGELLECPEVGRIIIMQNIPERVVYPADARLVISTNKCPRGYGSNQNAAFSGSTSPFFCVLNPDIRLDGNPFPALLQAMQDARIAASAPVIYAPDGRREDSARKFPTALGLLTKALGAGDGTYRSPGERQNPDWLAGMFLLLRSPVFREVGGFDERYFLYYEDVDLCRRLRCRGYLLRQVQTVHAVHAARRASRRNAKHARWHLTSMVRFLIGSIRP